MSRPRSRSRSVGAQERALGSPTHAELREANESLVLATVKAQVTAEAAESASRRSAYRAEHDALTGLPNRELLAERMSQALIFARRHGHQVALMYLDLDSFKQINDTLGHALGDQLLKSVAERLQQCVRHSDTITVGRQGGDEFFLLLPEVEAEGEELQIARKLIKVMDRPHELDGHTIQVTLSIGISLFPRDAHDLASLVTNADIAMYHAKLNGRNNYQSFQPGMERPPTLRQAEGEGGTAALMGRRRLRLDAGSPAQAPGPIRLQDGGGRRAVRHQLQLREANESLVLATLEAHRLAEVAEQANAQLVQQTLLEARLMEAQKLETISLLAGGVAHDFNNLLTTIFGYADMGRLAAEQGDPVTGYFDSIEKSATKAAELTRQLLAYAGKGSTLVTEVDLTHLVQEMTTLLSVSIPKRVTLHCEQMDRLPFVKGDGTQLLQLLMNLITNAAEAFGQGVGGEITVRTRAEGIEAVPTSPDGWVLPLAPGHYATLEVSDSGAGMTPAILQRIFDPFFTTKTSGHGLGLAAVVGIIRAHGGALKVQSEPGHGSSFKIFLPAMQEARTLPYGEVLPDWRGEGLILVADADPAVRQQARQLAEQHGFSVTEAEDVPGALESFRLHHQELALVLMGLGMPPSGGRDAFREMQGIDRRVPLVASARHDAANALRPAKGTAGFLRTPYRAAEFQGLLRRALASRKTLPV